MFRICVDGSPDPSCRGAAPTLALIFETEKAVCRPPLEDMMMKCPRCGEETDSTGNPFRPFCSERCKMIDLGNWITGAYRMPGTDASEDASEASKPPKDSGEE